MDAGTAGERARQAARLADLVADTYDHVGVDFFQPIAAQLVAADPARPGERVVDMGCGRGAVTSLLAQVVGPGGRVTAFDISRRMLELTEAEFSARGLHNIDYRVGDAMSPDLTEQAFDGIYASLVVFLLPGPAEALGGWLPLLRPGGRLAITTFGEPDEMTARIEALFRPYVPRQVGDPRSSGNSGWFSSPEATTRLVRSAGFTDVSTRESAITVTFAGPEQWHAWSWSHMQRGRWLSVPETERERVRERAFAVVEDYRDARGIIARPQAIRITTARRA